jgi:hypothetical protein
VKVRRGRENIPFFPSVKFSHPESLAAAALIAVSIHQEAFFFSKLKPGRLRNIFLALCKRSARENSKWIPSLRHPSEKRENSATQHLQGFFNDFIWFAGLKCADEIPN